MSEDCDVQDDPTVCCIYACGEPSTVCFDGQWYCDMHGKEYVESRESIDENGLRHPKPETQVVPYDYKNYVAPEKKLEDVGTRFQHISNFQEHIEAGLIAVTNSLAKYANETDVIRKAKLEACLAFIKAYQESLAGYESKKWDFKRMIDACEPSRTVIAAIKAEKEHERAKRAIKLKADAEAAKNGELE